MKKKKFVKTRAKRASSDQDGLNPDISIMARFTDGGRIRHYLDLIVHEVREYVRMLSQFFRRILGIGVRADTNDYDADISACESQSSLSSSESAVSSLSPLSKKEYVVSVDLTSECEDKSSVLQDSLQTACLVENSNLTTHYAREIADVQTPTLSDKDYMDGTNVSINVNYDYNELEARAGNEEFDFSDIEQSKEVGDVQKDLHVTGAGENNTSADSVGESGQPPALSPGHCPLPESSDDSIPEWDWGTFLDERTQETLQAYYMYSPQLLPDTNESGVVWSNTDVTDYPGPDTKRATVPHQDNVSNRSGQNNHDSLSDGEYCEPKQQNARKSSSQENTSTLKKGNASFRSPRKSSKSRRPDTPCPKMFHVPPSEAAMEMVLTDAPYPEPSDSYNLLKHTPNAKKKLWGKMEPDPSSSSSSSDSEKELDDTNPDVSLQSQDPEPAKPLTQPKYIRPLPAIRFRPEIRTRDKYTYTLETYSTLCQCKILKGRLDRFNQEYINCLPSDLVKTLRGWSRAVLVKPAKGVRVECHFDLSCLNVEPSHVFLYDAPSAFERAAYRMDDHIVPQQSRKKHLDSHNEKKKKVKRRGVPNKHLQDKSKEHEYTVNEEEEAEEEEGAVGGDDCGTEKQEDSFVEEEVAPPEAELEVKTESPRMDFRHFEGVPVAVVQKKKNEDDIEVQYAVCGIIKKKNKNKKKPPKNQPKGNPDCEEIKNILLGGDTGRRRGNARPRYT